MRKALSVLVVLSMVLGLSAFACTSTELTSAKLYIQQKNLDKAKDALEKEISKNAKSDEGFYLLGFINGEEANFKSMVENFDKSIAISKKFEKNINDSKKYHWQDNFNKGVGFFNKGTKATKEGGLVGTNETDLISCLGKADKVVESNDQTLGNSKMFIYERFNLHVYTSNHIVTSTTTISDKNEANIKLPECVNTSQTYFEKSIERFNNCILVEPDSVSSYQNMFYAMINAGRDESELEAPLLKIIELKKAPEAYVDLSKIYNNRALAFMNSFKDSKNIDDSLKAMTIYNKEIALLEEGQKLNPDDSKILAQLSNAYVDANKMDVAMATFQKGIEKDPQNEVYRYNYGVLLLGAEDFENAVTQFQKAIDLKEDYSSAYYNLGITYLKWGADLQEKAIEADSNDKTFKEKFSLAVIPLEKYLQENQEDADIWNYLGKIYANLGQTDKSKEAFDKADLYR